MKATNASGEKYAFTENCKWRCRGTGSGADRLKPIYDFEETNSSLTELPERRIYQYVRKALQLFVRQPFNGNIFIIRATQF